MFTVYGLINPLTRDLFYVGCTTNPTRRMHDHRRHGDGPAKNGRKIKAYIAAMRESGNLPAMIVLEHTTDATREHAWITFFWSLGLVNTAHRPRPPKRPIGRPRTRPAKVRRTAQERAFMAWATKRAKALLKP